MADGTHIEWTDATWNVITGCSVVSAGCKHCYAMKLAGTRLQHDPSRAGLTVQTQAGPVWNGQVRFNEKWLDQPLRWRRPRRIFVCAHGDLFHEAVPEDWIDFVFAVMAEAPQHTFQVLTKRPARALAYLTAAARRAFVDEKICDLAAEGRVHGEGWDGVWPLQNVWLGVSVEDQAAADERIPLLLQCPAMVRWISAEPLLGRVDLCEHLGMWWNSTMQCFEGTGQQINRHSDGRPRIGWVVAGGESGHGARPMHPDWPRSLRDQCAAAGVPFLFKQWGEWAPDEHFTHMPRRDADMHEWCDGDLVVERSWRYGKKATGRLLDGVQHDGYPKAP